MIKKGSMRDTNEKSITRYRILEILLNYIRIERIKL